MKACCKFFALSRICPQGYQRRHGEGTENRNGDEIAWYVVRLEGQTHDRYSTESDPAEGGDTPTGVYDIPNTNPWQTYPENTTSYGPNPRLQLDGLSGEIISTGRSLLRDHGGRQGQDEHKQEPTEPLQKTNGCVRWYDSNILNVKTLTDQLQSNDPLEFPVSKPLLMI